MFQQFKKGVIPNGARFLQRAEGSGVQHTRIFTASTLPLVGLTKNPPPCDWLPATSYQVLTTDY